MDGTDLRRSERLPDLALCKQVMGPATEEDEGSPWPEPWPARTLVVAAGKGGLVPSNDRPDDARKLAEIGKRLNPETGAVTHRGMRHPWSRQDPKLFAAALRAWIEGRELPPGFEGL